MQVWFSKFIRGRVFSVLFCILGFGLTIYLSSRLGILIEGFAGLDLQLAIFLILTVFCTYMLIYVNIHREEQENTEVIQPMWNHIFFFSKHSDLFFLVRPDKIPLRSLPMGGYTSFHCCWLLFCLPMDLSMPERSL